LIQWQFFPRSDTAPEVSLDVVASFEDAAAEIDSESHELRSDDVLAAIFSGLTDREFLVESCKKRSEKVIVPVLYGRNGQLAQSFEADAWDRSRRMVLEVEAGRGVTNYQFLKDLFEACMMHDVDFLGIAVRNTYRKNRDFERVVRFFETLYASNRLVLPLKGILVVGY
jgi:hypothetical protein